MGKLYIYASLILYYLVNFINTVLEVNKKVLINSYYLNNEELYIIEEFMGIFVSGSVIVVSYFILFPINDEDKINITEDDDDDSYADEDSVADEDDEDEDDDDSVADPYEELLHKGSSILANRNKKNYPITVDQYNELYNNAVFAFWKLNNPKWYYNNNSNSIILIIESFLPEHLRKSTELFRKYKGLRYTDDSIDIDDIEDLIIARKERKFIYHLTNEIFILIRQKYMEK